MTKYGEVEVALFKAPGALEIFLANLRKHNVRYAVQNGVVRFEVVARNEVPLEGWPVGVEDLAKWVLVSTTAYVNHTRTPHVVFYMHHGTVTAGCLNCETTKPFTAQTDHKPGTREHALVLLAWLEEFQAAHRACPLVPPAGRVRP
jgi:hypothetical protein